MDSHHIIIFDYYQFPNTFSPFIITYAEDILHDLYSNKYLNVATWFIKECIKYETDINYNELFETTCKSNFLEQAKLLIEKIDMDEEYYLYIFHSVCLNGYLNMAKFLFETVYCKINVNDDDEYIFRHVCVHGHLELAKWLIELFLEELEFGTTLNMEQFTITVNDAFIMACSEGRLEVAKWLEKDISKFFSDRQIISFSTLPDDVKNDAFSYICEGGYLELAKWLINECNYANNPIDVNANDDQAFRLACLDGRLELVQWLINNFQIDIHTDEEFAFRASCGEGHFELAKWFYDNFSININIRNESAFRWVCDEGHLEIAMWLYEKSKIDIHANDDEAFISACEKKHLELAKWLCGLDTNYEVIMEYDKIIGWKIKNIIDEVDVSEFDKYTNFEKTIAFSDCGICHSIKNVYKFPCSGSETEQ